MKTIAIYDGRAYVDGRSVAAAGPIEEWSPGRAASKAFDAARTRGDVLVLPDDPAEALTAMRETGRLYGFARLVPSWREYAVKLTSQFFAAYWSMYWTTYDGGENEIHRRVAPRIGDERERVFSHPTHSADTSKIRTLSGGVAVIVRRRWLAQFGDLGCAVWCAHRHLRPYECCLCEALS